MAERAVSVLLVDDDADIREVFTEILTEAGYTVASAADGRQALALLGEVRPRLILLDLNMPVMNGRQFREVQRRDPTLGSIPTVVLSAVDRISVQVAELAAAGALPKPVPLADLLALVERFCGPPAQA